MEWVFFLVLIAALLYFDLDYVNKEPKEISVPAALRQSAFWITISILFGSALGCIMGFGRGAEWFTAYVIEKSLSVDNLFVFLAIFSYFKIQPAVQHKVLYWGIIGALILRFIAIAGGVLLLSWIHWLTYVFGTILIYTAWKVSFSPGAEQEDFDKTWFAKWLQKRFRFHFAEQLEDRFFYLFPEGKPYKLIRYGTKILFVLLIIEATDLIFATDSIPAALACSNNAFVIYTSNIFAVLGLRSLFFALSAMMGKFEYLKYGISLVLAMVGLKMLLAGVFTMATGWWLLLVALLLSGSIVASLRVAPDALLEEVKAKYDLKG